MGIKSNNPNQVYTKVFNRTGVGAIDPPPEKFVATGGWTSEYSSPASVHYKVHIFNASGAFVVESGEKEIDWLVVGGGGGGGALGGGGGGGGGLRSSVDTPGGPSASPENAQTVKTGTYTVTIGEGGIGSGEGSSAYGGIPGQNGYPTTIALPSSITVGGGGGGGSNLPGSDPTGLIHPQFAPQEGAGGVNPDGGSAGGQNGGNTGGGRDAVPGTYGYPNFDIQSDTSPYGGYGGSGTGGQGGKHPGMPSPNDQKGGAALTNTITGASRYYGAGGGGGPGGLPGANPPSGGDGGTGNGQKSDGTSPNTGTGGVGGLTGWHGAGCGGGGGWQAPASEYAWGGAGGRGICIVRYQIPAASGTAKATGGEISFYNNKTIHTFRQGQPFATPGSFNETCEYVLVGGGGAGGFGGGGGGGAGGYVTGTTPIGSSQTVSITIGKGGQATGWRGPNPNISIRNGYPGDNTEVVFPAGPQVAYGGGGGGSHGDSQGEDGNTNSSGGGGAGQSYPGPAGGPQKPGGSGGSSSGYAGGTGVDLGGGHNGGGGGGHGAVGKNGNSGSQLNDCVGGLGVQLPSTFQDPANALGAPGPAATKWWVCGGGGGGKYSDDGPGNPGGYSRAAGGGATPSTLPSPSNPAPTNVGSWCGGGQGAIWSDGTHTSYPGSGPQSDQCSQLILQSGGAAWSNTGGGGGGGNYTSGGRGGGGGSGGPGLVLIAYPT